MNERLLAGTTLALLLVAGSAPAAEPLKSGLPVGSGNRGRFEPSYITGQPGCPV